MKHFVIYLVVTFTIPVVHAQDTILLRTGDTIMAKVLEIDIEKIKYNKIDHFQGPVYYIDKNAVFQISYESGHIDTFEIVERELPQAKGDLSDLLITDKNHRYSIKYRGIGLMELRKLVYETEDPQIIKLFNQSVQRQVVAYVVGWGTIPVAYVSVFLGILGGGTEIMAAGGVLSALMLSNNIFLLITYKKKRSEAVRRYNEFITLQHKYGDSL